MSSAAYAEAGIDAGASVEAIRVIESGPSLAARTLFEATQATVYPALSIGARVLDMPLPYGALDTLARLLPAPPGVSRAAVPLPHATAELIRARGVPAGTSRAVLYLHGGGFLCCGVSTHLHMINRVSRYAGAPVLAVDYRLLPHHSINDALEDCRDGYDWLRAHGHSPERIAVAGDSAGGYLAMALAQKLLARGERPGALALLSPLLELESKRPRRHGAMLPHNVFAALTHLIEYHGGTLYEPLDHITSGMPATMIQVSGSEELVYDARRAAGRLSDAGVSAELHEWPGQIHVFQIAAPLIPEARRSLRQVGEFIREMTW